MRSRLSDYVSHKRSRNELLFRFYNSSLPVENNSDV